VASTVPHLKHGWHKDIDRCVLLTSNALASSRATAGNVFQPTFALTFTFHLKIYSSLYAENMKFHAKAVIGGNYGQNYNLGLT